MPSSDIAWLIIGSYLTNKLKKDNITLKGEVKEEWLERFERLKSEIQVIDTAITQAEQTLNQLTYQLYGLTTEETNLIEGE
ncbi:MAG: hypothetical protein K0U45_06970 [Alphaproteobacteria bacterium]|nr:hypothetical protein [Alphaproteobacteria bacterium]